MRRTFIPNSIIGSRVKSLACSSSVFITISILAGCSSTLDQNAEMPDHEPGSRPDETITTIASAYRGMRLITPEPVYVDPDLSMMCVGVSTTAIEEATGRNGPHAHSTIRIYMNDVSRASFLAGGSTYPVGSVIVKEKKFLAFQSEGKAEQVDRGNGVGGMVKRQFGYDSDNGDWEYFYFDSLDDIESGRIATCIACHRQTRDTDYVFGSWNEIDRQP